MKSTQVQTRIESPRTKPILLFNNECGVCRRIAHWVTKAAITRSGKTTLIVQPIGEDPQVLKLLNSGLDIWEAYATIHLLLPDGTIKRGGEAVAEVFRNVPNARWFSWCFSKRILGFRPFQAILNLGYAILADIRPIFGCESCGAPVFWMKPIAWVLKQFKSRNQGQTLVHRSVLPHKF